MLAAIRFAAALAAGVMLSEVVVPAGKARAQGTADLGGHWEALSGGAPPGPATIRMCRGGIQTFRLYELYNPIFFSETAPGTYSINYGGSVSHNVTVEVQGPDLLWLSWSSSTGRSGIQFRKLSSQPTRDISCPANAQPVPAALQPPARQPTTATVNVRNVGLYGTRCVRASIRNLRRPAEANPHPTSWVGDWVLTNSCPLPQWVRIEVQGATLSWSGGLHHPGARMQPSPRLVPALWFTPINEIDFELHWLVPANGELVNPNPVIHQAVQEGMDVWIASCDAVGPQERQAIYLSARLPRGPEVACYNHGLPDGGLIAALDRAIQRNPQDVGAYFLRGWTYYRQGNHARAIVDYDQVIRINPQDWSAFNNRGRAYQAQGNNARAFADFDEAIRLNPRVWNAFFNRGRLYQSQRDYARAVADLDEAVRLNPTYAFAYETRGFARARLNDRVRAAADYRAAARLEPGNAGIQNGVCWNMVVAGEDLAVARAACDAALRIAPGNAGYLDSRGLVGLKQGRFQEAWSDYDAALRAEDNNAHYRYGRGVAALRLGREAEGRADIAAATARDPAIAENYRSYGIIP